NRLFGMAAWDRSARAPGDLGRLLPTDGDGALNSAEAPAAAEVEGGGVRASFIGNVWGCSFPEGFRVCNVCTWLPCLASANEPVSPAAKRTHRCSAGDR
ncbi:hypothetical protein ACNRD9_23740, partial [Ralstonia pseudosolanacearum]